MKFYSALVLIFNISNSIGLQFLTGRYKIPAQQQAMAPTPKLRHLKIMGQYTDLLYSTNNNSIASTVKSILQPLKSFGFVPTNDPNEILGAFSILLGQRAQAAMFSGVTKGNYLLDTGVNIYNAMYEECFVTQTQQYKLDLPLFAFTAMYLESHIKRDSLRAADPILKKEYFECIYDTCFNSYPQQCKFNRIQAVDVMNTFLMFISKRYRN